MSRDLIAQAIEAHWGERCPDYVGDCPTCAAWKEYDRIATLEDQLATVRAETEWQLIETAPRDGSEILVAGPAWNGKTTDAAQYVAVVLWVRDAWRESDDEDEHPVWAPTHWCPLPAPPAVEKGA